MRKLVLAPDVVVSGMRSPRGASAVLLVAAGDKAITPLARFPLAIEYEAICCRREQMKQITTYPLRLPRSLKEAVARVAKEEGTSINQFVMVAVAEKLAALETASFFAERRQRADFDAFDRVMNRKGGEPPRPGDEPE